MATKGFTKISNSIIFDKNLSIEATGLYIKIVHYNAIPNFKLNRDFIKKLSGYGDTAFRRVWKELKDKGVIHQISFKENGRFGAEYIVNTSTLLNETKDDAEHLDEVPEDNEEIISIKNETNFNSKQANDLLKIADVKTIIKYCKYVASKGAEVKNKFAYTRKLIVDKVQIVKDKVTGWSNYDQRTYDFSKLESAIYGECSLSEAMT